MAMRQFSGNLLHGGSLHAWCHVKAQVLNPYWSTADFSFLASFLSLHVIVFYFTNASKTTVAEKNVCVFLKKRKRSKRSALVALPNLLSAGHCDLALREVQYAQETLLFFIDERMT